MSVLGDQPWEIALERMSTQMEKIMDWQLAMQTQLTNATTANYSTPSPTPTTETDIRSEDVEEAGMYDKNKLKNGKIKFLIYQSNSFSLKINKHSFHFISMGSFH